jgi:hypothetical protein
MYERMQITPGSLITLRCPLECEEAQWEQLYFYEPFQQTDAWQGPIKLRPESGACLLTVRVQTNGRIKCFSKSTGATIKVFHVIVQEPATPEGSPLPTGLPTTSRPTTHRPTRQRESGLCKTVELSGAMYHNTSNGVYTLRNDIHCNTRPVWADATNSHYIYYLLDGFDGWMVSPTSCYNWGNFMVKAKSDADVPYGVWEEWYEFAPEEQMWREAEGLSISCVHNDGVPEFGNTFKPPTKGPWDGLINARTLPDELRYLKETKAVQHAVFVVCIVAGTLLAVFLVLGIVRHCRKHTHPKPLPTISGPMQSGFKYKPLDNAVSNVSLYDPSPQDDTASVHSSSATFKYTRAPLDDTVTA